MATVAGFAPLYLFPLPILTLALLMRAWQSAENAPRAAALGWWFGLGFFLTGVSWVYVSLHTFGAMPLPLAAFFTLLFCAFLALFPALVAYGCVAMRGPLWARLVLIGPALWTLAEWTRGWIFTGFPWLGLGYSQVPMSPLAGYAPILGIYGVTLLTVLSAALLVLPSIRDSNARTSASGPKRYVFANIVRHPAWVVLAAVWLGGYGLKQIAWTRAVGEPVSVSLLQGNIAQETKWREDALRTTLLTYLRLTRESKAKLIILPETALPLFLRDVPADYLNELAAHARSNGGDVLIGVPERLPAGDYYNSVVSFGISPGQAYRKTHLVPFGEFIPLRPVLGWLVSVLAIPLQDFSRGSATPKPLAVAGQRVAVNICYEDVFGEEIIRQLPEASLLVNVSNVAWFGRSMAPQQHLQISQARALETGRYMLRATNTGMTAVVDERGTLVQAAPQFTLATVNASVQGYAGATPYVRWGNAAILILSCVLLLAGFFVTRRPQD
jgi:apolipoprotein N-acyltransferase